MKIWYGITTTQYLKYKKYYTNIRNILLDRGVILTRDWYPYVEEDFKLRKGKKRNMEEVYKAVTKAIDQANAVIIESTIPSFSISHQIYYAILRQKPTLVLQTKNANINFSDAYIGAIDSKYLIVRNYDSKNLEKIIDEF
ncbi:MAG: hypothetical protein Q9M91_02565 [Candidatus Dojkabacteria bacterium]|nr:hypothetical protein [Candidatus Dojkabacteria bacterium]MDQ7020708.1 hypothetical protein [Candidatus Dojkabacteria bacterium]